MTMKAQEESCADGSGQEALGECPQEDELRRLNTTRWHLDKWVRTWGCTGDKYIEN